MNETYVTISGNVVAPPDRRVAQNGAPFCAFRVASTVRRRNREGEFVDGPTSYYSVTAFRALGLNVGNSLEKGDPVIVHGRQRVNQWQRQDGSYGTSVEIDAYNVGHDLTRGTSSFTRQTKSQMDTGDRLGDPEVQAAHDELEADGKSGGGRPLGDPETDAYTVRNDDRPDDSATPGTAQAHGQGDAVSEEPAGASA
jgi:single-strand DNA-binding protein